MSLVHKVNIQNSIVFLYTSNKQLENKLESLVVTPKIQEHTYI
jgi:hypothetical protein